MTGDDQPQMVVRCLWCVGRAGEARYQLDGQWFFEHPMVAHMLRERQVTDGICPDCLAVAKQELRLQKPELASG